MSAVPLTCVLQHVRSMAVDDLTDQQLVQRFAGLADHAAFAALVRRHGPLVLGVGRRLLGPGPDLDDVFQATFVVLARKAATIRKQTAVASWLYGVAYRLALKLRSRRGRRQRREHTLPSLAETSSMRVDPSARASLRELGAILDEELQRLPAGCRDAVLLCHLEGLSNTEAAAQLGWPLGTLKGRVQRGRALLRQRLSHRGVTLSSAALALTLAEQSRAAVPASLIRATVRCASPTAVAARVALLADGAVQTLTATKLKLAVIAVLSLGAVAIATGTLWSEPANMQPSAKPTVGAAPQAQGNAPGVDLFGDPLPPGATARLGTVRWRHGSPASFAALAPDGKTVVSSANDRWVRVWDLASGKELRRFGPGPRLEPRSASLGQWARGAVAMSKDGALAATHFDSPQIDLWEVATGKKVGSIPLEKRKPGPGVAALTSESLAFSPDGRHLAIGLGGFVGIWDIAAGKTVRELGRLPKQTAPVVAARQNGLAYAPDGKTLVSLLFEVEGQAFVTHVQFWDPENGQKLHTFDYESRFGVTSPVFSPDGKLFAFASPDGEVCLLEANSARLLRKKRLTAMQDWPALVFAGDSSKLFVKGAGEGTVREWDVQNLKEIGAVASDARTSVLRFAGPNGCLALSPDGKTLAIGGGSNALRLVDAATGKARPTVGGHSHGLTSLGFLPDGKTMTTLGHDLTLRVWESGSGQPLRSIAVPKGAVQFAASPDARWTACENDRGDILLIDNQTGKEIATIRDQDNHLPTLLFSPDGGTLLVRGFQAASVVLYDVPSGKERGRLKVGPAAHTFAPLFFFSADGKRCALQAAPGSFTIHDLATAKALQTVVLGPDVQVWSAALAPDGRTVALDQGDGTVRVIELATGQERRSYGKKYGALAESAPGGMMGPLMQMEGQAGPGLVAFSPNCRLLAQATQDNALVVWDLATGKSLARFEGHQTAIVAVVFAPDGLSVATASGDTTALVWDVQALAAKAGPLRVLDAASVQSCWADLGTDKAAVAFEAINTLATAPVQALALLREKLKPEAAVDAKRIQQLIDVLDVGEFKVRQQALTDLLKIGEQAVPRMEQVLAGKVTLEMRQRLELLRDKLTATTWTGERLRTARAVELLERIGNVEARAILQSLADGAPGGLLSAQARGALARLR